MKNKQRIALGLIAIMALSATACKKNEAPGAENTEQVNSVETEAPLAEEGGNPYEAIIVNYDKSIGFVDVKSPAKSEEEQKATLVAMAKLKAKGATSTEIFTFFKENIEGLRTPYSDDFAAYAISGIQKNSFEDYRQTEPYFSDMTRYDLYMKEAEKYEFSYLELKRHTDQIVDPVLKELMAKAIPQGYIYSTAEGMVFPVTDYTEFAKYKTLYSPEFGALLNQLAYNNVSILASDGGLVIGYDQVAARIFEADKQLQASKETENNKYHKFLVMEYVSNLSVLLFGLDNTPAYDYETLKLKEELALLYKKMAEEKDSKTATYIQMHMANLEAEKGLYTEATMDQIRKLIQKIKADYKVSPEDEAAYTEWYSGEMK